MVAGGLVDSDGLSSDLCMPASCVFFLLIFFNINCWSKFIKLYFLVMKIEVISLRSLRSKRPQTEPTDTLVCQSYRTFHMDCWSQISPNENYCSFRIAKNIFINTADRSHGLFSRRMVHIERWSQIRRKRPGILS